MDYLDNFVQTTVDIDSHNITVVSRKQTISPLWVDQALLSPKNDSTQNSTSNTESQDTDSELYNSDNPSNTTKSDYFVRNRKTCIVSNKLPMISEISNGCETASKSSYLSDSNALIVDPEFSGKRISETVVEHETGCGTDQKSSDKSDTSDLTANPKFAREQITKTLVERTNEFSSVTGVIEDHSQASISAKDKVSASIRSIVANCSERNTTHNTPHTDLSRTLSLPRVRSSPIIPRPSLDDPHHLTVRSSLSCPYQCIASPICTVWGIRSSLLNCPCRVVCVTNVLLINLNNIRIPQSTNFSIVQTLYLFLHNYLYGGTEWLYLSMYLIEINISPEYHEGILGYDYDFIRINEQYVVWCWW